MGASSIVLASTALVLTNPLSTEALLRTLFFQVGILGIGTNIVSGYLSRVVAWADVQGMSKLRTRANRIIILLLGSYLWKGLAFIILTGTTVVVLTDVGWPPAFQHFGFGLALLMARASDAPNGAHLVSYVAVALTGVYFSVRFRKDNLLDSIQAILFTGFLVAFHELPWLVFYLVRYYGQLGLFVGSNFIEDAGFALMCLLLVVAWYRYPQRALPMKAFVLPFVAYLALLSAWFAFGLPVTTVNNFQIGKGPFEITTWWADPWVNGIEVLSWVQVSVSLGLVVRHSKS